MDSIQLHRKQDSTSSTQIKDRHHDAGALLLGVVRARWPWCLCHSRRAGGTVGNTYDGCPSSAEIRKCWSDFLVSWRSVPSPSA